MASSGVRAPVLGVSTSRRLGPCSATTTSPSGSGTRPSGSLRSTKLVIDVPSAASSSMRPAVGDETQMLPAESKATSSASVVNWWSTGSWLRATGAGHPARVASGVVDALGVAVGDAVTMTAGDRDGVGVRGVAGDEPPHATSQQAVISTISADGARRLSGGLRRRRLQRRRARGAIGAYAPAHRWQLVQYTVVRPATTLRRRIAPQRRQGSPPLPYTCSSSWCDPRASQRSR